MPSALPVLLTKLYIPASRPQWLRRERLFARLDQALEVGLTVLATPAGYGKTTLLAQWIGDWRSKISDFGLRIADRRLKTSQSLIPNPQSEISNPQFSWLSLDEGDNDPVRFWIGLVAALQTCPGAEGLGSSFLELLHASRPQAAPVEQGLVLLLNALARFPSTLVLALDDFHVLTNPALLASLSFFLERLPANLHLILAGRGDPALPLARFRARGRILELHAADLRFTAGETSAYFQASTALDLAPEDVAVLEQRAEGWIAGLQLAALSLEGLEDPRAFIHVFRGDDRYILDYLTEEVLARLPEEIQDFLLKTSMLERMTGELCDYVVESREPRAENRQEAALRYSVHGSRITTSQSILEHLDSSNLFLIPLDNTRTWYRYHRLFADLLQARLRRLRPEIIPELHHRAAGWLADQGTPVEAFRHAVASGDLDLAARLVGETLAGQVEDGAIATLSAWMQAFPEHYVLTRPELCLAMAWTHLYQVRFDQAETWALRTSVLLSPLPADPYQWGQIEAIRATVAINHKDFEGGIVLSKAALQHLPPPQWGLARGLIFLNLGDAQSVRGDFLAAIDSHENALAVSQPYGNHTLDVIIIGSLGDQYLHLGRLRQAEAVLSQALLVEKDALLAGGDSALPALGKPLVYLSRIYLEWHRLDLARELADRALEYCRRWEHPDHLLDAHLALAEVCQITGEPAEMQAALDRAREHVQRIAAHGSQEQFYSWSQRGVEMRRRLRREDWEGLERLLADFEILPDLEFNPHTVEAAALAGYTWVHAGRFAEATALAASLAGQADRRGWLRAQIQSRLLLALAERGSGRGPAAQAALVAALHLAEPEGYVRLFLDAGKEGGLLISDCRLLMDDRRFEMDGVQKNRLIQYIDHLLTFFQETSALPFSNQKSSIYNLSEALSSRELDVLRLLAAGLTNDQIAAELYLSTNTVKTHLKRIFEKLGVTHRMEAANLARERGWI